jgi:phosphocarrier protein
MLREIRRINMVSGTTVIKNPSGLHLRPAGILCKEALLYKSKISFKVRNVTANAKSVLSVLGACVKCGDEIELVCEGADEQEALKAVLQSGNTVPA